MLIPDTYQKLKDYKASLFNLLDTTILTPYELGAHSEITLMCEAYFAQFCLYFSEFGNVVPVPEEVQVEYGPVSCLGVVVSHELPFTAKQDQAKQSSITGIIVRKSTLNMNSNPVMPDESIESISSLDAKVQEVVDVTNEQENSLREYYPLWKMYNFKIRYASSKGTPVQIKFNVSFEGRRIEFDTKEMVTVRTNDTQTPSFEAKTFIVNEYSL